MAQRLLLLEDPPQSAFDNCAFFRHFGFDVRGYPLNDIFSSTHLKYSYYSLKHFFKTGDFGFLPELIRRHYKNYREIPKFHDFDIVVIFVDSAVQFPVRRAVLEQIKQEILSAQRKRRSQIHLFGIDVSSSEEFIPEQETFFNELFLPGFPFLIAEKLERVPPESSRYIFRNQIVPFEKAESIMNRLLSRPMNEYERKYVEIHFPRQGFLKNNNSVHQSSA